MRVVTVAEVRIDQAGHLLIMPNLAADEDLRFIYRAGHEANWDAAARALTAPVPKAWSHFDWFREVASAVAEEYAIELVVTDATKWNVPESLRRDIEAACRVPHAHPLVLDDNPRAKKNGHGKGIFVVLLVIGIPLTVLCGITVAIDVMLLTSAPEFGGALAILTFPLPGLLLGVGLICAAVRCRRR